MRRPRATSSEVNPTAISPKDVRQLLRGAVKVNEADPVVAEEPIAEVSAPSLVVIQPIITLVTIGGRDGMNKETPTWQRSNFPDWELMGLIGEYRRTFPQAVNVNITLSEPSR